MAGSVAGGSVVMTFVPGVAAAQREQHSMARHQRPSRSVTTARTTAPPHRHGSGRAWRTARRLCVVQPSVLHAQYASARGAVAACRWVLRWATAAARPAAADGRRCAAQEGRLHETRTAVLPRPAASRRTVQRRPSTRSSSSLVTALRPPWPPSRIVITRSRIQLASPPYAAGRPTATELASMKLLMPARIGSELSNPHEFESHILRQCIPPFQIVEVVAQPAHHRVGQVLCRPRCPWCPRVRRGVSSHCSRKSVGRPSPGGSFSVSTRCR